MSGKPGLLLKAMQPLLDPALVSARALAEIVATVSSVPEALTGGYLECRLGGGSGRTDILLGTLGTSTRRFLAEEAGWPAVWRQDHTWRSLLGFYAAWAAPDSLVGRRIPLTLLEFDVEGPPKGIPVPGFHFCLDPEFEQRHAGLVAPEGTRPDTADLVELVQAAMSFLPLGALVPSCLARLVRCHEQLPEGGRLLHLSQMYARSGAPLKLNAVVPRSGLLEYLANIGWPGSGREVLSTLERYAPAQRLDHLDLALGPDLGPRLGLEFSSAGGLERLLRLLESEGLCTGEETKALLAWRGPGAVQLDEQSWPVRVERDVVLKLVLDGPMRQVKAYLFFQPRFCLLA